MTADRPRPLLLVQRVHPGVKESTSRHLATALAATAEAYGADVDELVAETVRAENSSAAGNDLST